MATISKRNVLMPVELLFVARSKQTPNLPHKQPAESTKWASICSWMLDTDIRVDKNITGHGVVDFLVLPGVLHLEP